MNSIKFTHITNWDFYIKTTFKVFLKGLLKPQFFIPFLIILAIIIYVSINSLGYSFRFISPVSIFILYLVVMYPWNIYRNAKANFESSASLKEKLEYEFSEEYLIIKGESFESKSQWKNYPKIFKIGNALLIYNTRLTAYFIDLNQMDSVERIYLIDMLKHITISNRIENNLK